MARNDKARSGVDRRLSEGANVRASHAAATTNPIGARGPFGFDGSRWGLQAPVEMHAIVGGPARTLATIAGGHGSRDFGLPDGGRRVVSTELGTRRVGSGRSH